MKLGCFPVGMTALMMMGLQHQQISGFFLRLALQQGTHVRWSASTVTTSKRCGGTFGNHAWRQKSELRAYSQDNNQQTQHGPFYSTLTSSTSKTVKTFKSVLRRGTSPQKTPMALLEGHRLVLEVLQNSHTSHLVQTVLVTSLALQHERYGVLLKECLAEERQRREEMGVISSSSCSKLMVYETTENILDECTDTVTPQGIAALCHLPPPYLPTTTQQQPQQQQPPLYLILDSLQDPGNVGTLLRSAAAVNTTAVLTLPGTANLWSTKALRSAMGATFTVPTKSFTNWKDCQDFLQHECHVDVKNRCFAATMYMGTDLDSTGHPSASVPHYQVDWCPSLPSKSSLYPAPAAAAAAAVCIGGEGNGLSPAVRHAVQQGEIRAVHVPMTGVESLNAGVAGSVILFEYARQCQCSFHASSRE